MNEVVKVRILSLNFTKMWEVEERVTSRSSRRFGGSVRKNCRNRWDKLVLFGIAISC